MQNYWSNVLFLEGKTRKDYDKAIQKFCQDNPDLTIYLAGEVSHPGISDLDFLVVDRKPVVSIDVEPFLMGGNVLIVPEKIIENVRILEDINLKLIQGKNYNLNSPPKEHKIIEILEWLPERILKCTWNLSNGHKIDDTLLLQKSINRSIDSVSLLLGRSYENISTDKARKENFSSKYLLENSIREGLSAWKDFEEYLKDTKILSGEVTGNLEFCKYYSFCDTFDSLLLYFHLLSKQNSSISKALKKRSSMKVENFLIDEELEVYARERWSLLSQTLDWFNEKNYKQGMIKYGWFLNDFK